MLYTNSHPHQINKKECYVSDDDDVVWFNSKMRIDPVLNTIDSLNLGLNTKDRNTTKNICIWAGAGVCWCMIGGHIFTLK